VQRHRRTSTEGQGSGSERIDVLGSPVESCSWPDSRPGLFSKGAHAQYSFCREDSVLSLSKGAHLTLYQDIYDTSTDITSITFQISIPTGVTVKSIRYVGPVPSSQQTITVTANENLGNCDAYTTVSTKTPNISVTAYVSGTNAVGTTTVSTHTNGHSGHQFHSHLHFT
jgi:hypothetical protein